MQTFLCGVAELGVGHVGADLHHPVFVRPPLQLCRLNTCKVPHVGGFGRKQKQNRGLRSLAHNKVSHEKFVDRHNVDYSLFTSLTLGAGNVQKKICPL